MSSRRQTGNNRFRNPKARKHLAFPDFVELLDELFPDRELMAKSVTLAHGEIVKGCVPKGSKAEEDFKWAGEFSQVNLVLAVILHELQKRGEQRVADMLSEVLQSSGAWEPPVGKRLIREKKVRAKVPWSRTTLWRKVKSGEFPAPVRLGNGMTAWLEADVDAWIDARVAEGTE